MVFLQMHCAYCAQKWCDSLWQKVLIHNVGARVAHATLQVCHGISTDALCLLCAKVV